MADDGVEIVGLEQLEKTFHELGPKVVKKMLHDALDYSGSVLQAAQSARAPILQEGEEGGSGRRNKKGKYEKHVKGQLKLDVRRVVTLDPDAGTGVVAVGPSRHSFYGMFREFGTSHEAAQPWMRPAFDAAAEEALSIFGEVLAAHIEANLD